MKWFSTHKSVVTVITHISQHDFLYPETFSHHTQTLITKGLFLCLFLLLVMQFEGNLIIIINNHKTKAFTKQPLYLMQSLKVRGGIALTARLIIEQREDRKTLGSRQRRTTRAVAVTALSVVEPEHVEKQKITSMSYYGNRDRFRLYHTGIHSCLKGKQCGSGQCVWVCVHWLMNVIFHALTLWYKWVVVVVILSI